MKEWCNLPSSFQNKEIRGYYDRLKKKRMKLVMKRLFDIIVSFVLLIILFPILFALAIWIKLDSPGPIFYRQVRVTTYGKTFRIFKFRTMVQHADKMGSLVTQDNDPRISRVGHKLRNWRLDELPQVINILLGDMSFVGTRPEVPKYVAEYTDEMKATLLLPAGVTSLASVKYKNEAVEISRYLKEGYSADEAYVKFILPEKMVYNLAYLEQVGLLYDIKLMAQTALAVLK